VAQPVIQTAFHSGEWAPALAARVDVGKYHSACALALNYYVDYRGGLSSRMGTKYILQAYKSATAVRLIPFQASQVVGYVLEFGDLYIRFYNNGAPVLEPAVTITAITQANPGQVTAAAHGYSDGEWGFLLITGMTELNGRYVQFANTTTNTFDLQDLNGNNINTSGFAAFVSGTVQRVYTLPSPYAAADLALLKYAQNVTDLYICHPDYAPYILRLNSAVNWTITPISFGATITEPTNISVATTLAAGTVNYSYTVTAVDAFGQESGAGTAAALGSRQDLRSVAGTNRITWTAVAGAVRYNVYKAEVSYTNAVAGGAAHGYIGYTASTTFDDSNIAPDFIETPPVVQNPFSGAGVEDVTITNPGTGYTSVPAVTFGTAPTGGATAQGQASMQIASATLVSGGANYSVGDQIRHNPAPGQPDMGVVLVVASVSGSSITGIEPLTFPGTNRGAVTSGVLSINNEEFNEIGGSGVAARFDLVWEVGAVIVTSAGAGYLAAPAVSFAGGGGAGAAATANLYAVAATNPSVPQFCFQRLWMLGPTTSPQQFDASQPGLYNNFNISDPTQPNDAISGTLVSGQLNEIKSAIAMPSGLIIFSDKSAWLLYGASPGQAATAVDVTAQPQAYVGASDVMPIIANDNILYIQANGSSVRNLNYNFYANVFTGTDISILSSHLFFNKEITEWCWAEEPFKTAWAIRSDGNMLSLTFVKEQELIGWTHSDTDGLWKSVTQVVEQLANVRVNAVYLVAERTIGVNTVKYIERMADRTFTNYTDCWCVDSGLQYDGAPATTFQGAEHLAGKTIVGLADGIPFSTVVTAGGTFTLSTAASLVTAGLQFVPDFQSLAIDTGNPTIQAKMKKLTGPTLRVQETLGLQVGQSFASDSLVNIDDLVLGNVGTMTNELVTGLVTGDVRQNLDPDWTEQGQFCVRQPLPYPATILGAIPELTIGDTER
jgi:hypothetical protein